MLKRGKELTQNKCLKLKRVFGNIRENSACDGHNVVKGDADVEREKRRYLNRDRRSRESVSQPSAPLWTCFGSSAGRGSRALLHY